MRIVCTVTNDLSHDQRMHRICGSLHAAGHEVTLLGRILPDSSELPPRPYRQLRIRCRAHRGKRFYIEFNFRLARLLRRLEYDVACAADLDTLPAACLAARPHHKLVYDAHEWFSETPEVYHRPAVRKFWRTLGRTLVPRTDARYTVGPSIADQLAKDYGMPFEVIRNLPEYKEVSFSENIEGVILYQGMLNPGRGLEVAIQAMALLPDCQLWIAGSGPESTALKKLARQLGVADRVRFLGFVAPDSLPQVTQQTWLGINLLESESPSYYYSLANKSLDYVQAGLPSVQMDFPEYRALQDRYGCFLLLDDLTAPELAARIRSLREDKLAYVRLQDNCVRAAGELCWEREEARLLEIYRRLEDS